MIRSQARFRVPLAVVLVFMLAMGLVAARTLYVNRAGAQCFGGPNAGVLCPVGDECGGVCVGGSNGGLLCPLGDECIGICVGGFNGGLVCPVGDECLAICVGGRQNGSVCDPLDPPSEKCIDDGGTCEVGVCSPGVCDVGVCIGPTGVEVGTANQPFITINGALAITVESDIIRVAPGVYNEIISIPFGVDMRGDDAATTILDGGGLGTVVTLTGPLNPPAGSRTGISGFTIRNGNSPLGGGILVQQGQPVIARNIITLNTSDQVGSFGGFGGGIALYRTRATCTNNLIFANHAAFKGGGIDVYRSPLALVINNTIVDNTSDDNAGGIGLSNTGIIKLSNNILTGNTAANGGGIQNYQSNPEVTFSDLWNNLPDNYDGMVDQTGLNGNISVDPQFMDLLLPDLSLQEMSSVIDAGTAENAPGDDFLGQVRPLDGDDDGTPSYDMGAYELRPFTDADGDGLDDLFDNCPQVPNLDQENSDSDPFGDACDNCVDFPNSGQQDLDIDGVGDLCDNCISIPNLTQTDTDFDGFGDACDPAPEDSSIPNSSIPTLGGAGMALLTLLLMVAMLWVWRRRTGLPDRR